MTTHTTGAAGSVVSAFSQYLTNRSNRREAKRNRAFQERMSSTAHQRETKDLELAGLNRILGMSGKGSSTPSGAMSTAISPGGATSALVVQQIKNLKAQEKLTGVQADALAAPGAISSTAGGIIERMKQFFEKIVGDIQVDNVNNPSRRIKAVDRVKTFPYNPPTSGKGQHFERNAIGWQEKDFQRHNQAGIRAVEAYAKAYPNSTEAEWRRIYAAAFKKSKGK